MNPENAGYAYVLLPSATEEEVKSYETAPEAEILRNDKACQAVKYTDGSVIATFWERGEVDGIAAENPCMVIVEGNRITLSDPTQKQDEIAVSVDGKEYRVTVKDKYGASVSLAK